MITGELKSKIDRIWDAFWSGGISNPLEVIEQILPGHRGAHS
jgi:type I restriction enzyme M protein